MQITIAWRPSEKKGKLRSIDLALCFSLPLLSNDPDLSTDIEMGCDFGEASEKWELGLCVAFEGRWENHKPAQILSPQEGAGKQHSRTVAQMRTSPSVFTPHAHVRWGCHFS